MGMTKTAKYSIGALIEHGDKVTNVPVRRVKESDLDRVKAEIRKSAPLGSTVIFDPAIKI